LIGIQEFRNSSIDNGQQITDNSLCSQLGDFSLEIVEEVALEEEIGVEEVETVEPTIEIAVTEEVIEVSGEEVIAEIVPEVVSEIQPEVAPEILNSYYIIGGSFQTEASAEKCLNGIKNQGFENASTLDKNEKGYIRVYYESFAEKADALVRLDEIKSKYDKSAWLLFQK
jgi:cell division protein FtsN